MYTITIWQRGKRHVKRYKTLDEAKAASQRIFTATGVIVAIEKEGP